MRRDKVISVRVNSKLLDEVNAAIMSKTEVWEGTRRTYYDYKDEKRPYKHDKFTVADLLEEKLREYLNEQKIEKL